MLFNVLFRNFHQARIVINIKEAKSRQISCKRTKEEHFPLDTDYSKARKRPSLYIIAVSFNNIRGVLTFLNHTATQCLDLVKPGAFHPDNVFVFLLPDCPKDQSRSLERIFSDSKAQKLRKAVAIANSRPDKSAQSLFLWRYNIYGGKIVASVSKGPNKSPFVDFDIQVLLSTTIQI